MNVKTDEAPAMITDPVAVSGAVRAAIDFLTVNPVDSFSVFVVEGVPRIDQQDRMGGELVQAMANGCGCPSVGTMREAFQQVVAYAREIGRDVTAPMCGNFEAETGNYLIGQESVHYNLRCS